MLVLSVVIFTQHYTKFLEWPKSKNFKLHYKGKKVKVHILDTVPLRSESPLQKRSGMARVLSERNTK